MYETLRYSKAGRLAKYKRRTRQAVCYTCDYVMFDSWAMQRHMKLKPGHDVREIVGVR